MKTKNHQLKSFVIAIALLFSGAFCALAIRPTYAKCNCTTDSVTREKTCTDDSGNDCSGTSGVDDGVELTKNSFKVHNIDSQDGVVPKIIKTILYIVGILSVIIIIYGGVQYTISTGDQSKVTSAKNTIIYGVVGLLISIFAYAIVSFVLNQLGA